VAVLGVEDDLDAVDEARGVARAGGLSYKLVLSNAAVREALGHVPLLPTTLYLSASGRVIHTVSGAVPESVMRGYLRDALAAR
jgi:hypothetical protein